MSTVSRREPFSINMRTVFVCPLSLAHINGVQPLYCRQARAGQGYMEHSCIFMEHSYILIMNLKMDPNNLHMRGVGNQDTVAYRWTPARKYMCKYTHWCVTQMS
jgi:hypothetical protein